MTASVFSRIITRRNEVEYESNLNAAIERGEEIAMADYDDETMHYNIAAHTQSKARDAATSVPPHTNYCANTLDAEANCNCKPTPSCGYSVCIAIGRCRNDHPGNRGVQWRAVQSTGGMWFLWRGTPIVDADDGDVEWDAIGPLDMLPQNYIHGDRHTGINAHSCCVHDPLIGCCDNHSAPSPDVNHACPVHGCEHDYRRCPLITSSAPEPSDGLPEDVLREIDAVTADCKNPRCSCGVGVNTKTMRALVAAARELAELKSEQCCAAFRRGGAYDSDTLCVLDRGHKAHHKNYSGVEWPNWSEDSDSREPGSRAAVLCVSLDHIAAKIRDCLLCVDVVRAYDERTQLRDKLARAERMLSGAQGIHEEHAKYCAERIIELERRIADARKECERALRSHPLLIEDLHSDLQRIATILEPPASGNTKE